MAINPNDPTQEGQRPKAPSFPHRARIWLRRHRHQLAAGLRPYGYRILAGMLTSLAVAALVAAYDCRLSMTNRLGVALVCVAGGCFLVIDVTMQHLIAEHAWFRRVLPIWCVVPFILVFVGGALQHFHTRKDAMIEVERLAREVSHELKVVDDARTTTSNAASDKTHAAEEAKTAPGPAASGAAVPGAPAPGAAAPTASVSGGSRPAAHRLAASRLPWRFPGSLLRPPAPPSVTPSGSTAVEADPARRDAPTAPPDPDDPCGTPTELDVQDAPKRYAARVIRDAVDQLSDARFGAKADEDERTRFRALARTIANDISSRSLTPAHVCRFATRDTFAGFVLALAVQGLFVFWIPCLLAVAIARARRAVDQQGHGRAFMPDGVKQSMKSRDESILGEKRPVFIPRVCFAILLFLGTNYVFAPLGLKTTYMMTLVDQHAAAGQTSFTLWTTNFSQAPVVVAGFVGFLLYALLTATQRFAQDDFDDEAMFSLLVRGLVMTLLSFALSSFPSTEVSRIFVFVAGVFPVRALEALAQKVSISLDPDFKSDEGKFDGLPSLDPAKAFALRAAGIRTTADLAAIEINRVAERVRINPYLLGRTVDRAILLDAVGKDIADQLEKCGIRLATELAELRGKIPSHLPVELAAVAELVAQRLAGEARVEAVRQWLANTSAAPVASETQQKVELGKRLYAQIAANDPEFVKDEFVSIDLNAFGQRLSVPILYKAFSDVAQFIDAVYYLLPPEAGIERYQYGRKWELRTKRDDPSTAVRHARLDVKLWGVPMPDPTSLESSEIRRGATLFAVPLSDRAQSASAPASSPATMTPSTAPRGSSAHAPLAEPTSAQGSPAIVTLSEPTTGSPPT